MKVPLPSRIPILYLVLTVLIAVGVFPLYFYATKVVEMNREQLKLNEKLLQNTVATALSQDIAQRGKDIRVVAGEAEAHACAVTHGPA